jgi:hypothetical protein
MPLELCWPGGEKAARLGKKDLARHIATYTAAKLAEMNMVGRWLASTYYPMARVAMGRQVWDLSRQFKLFSDRLHELQGNLKDTYMTAHFREALSLVSAAQTFEERLAGLYHIIFRYEQKIFTLHRELTEPVTEWYLTQVMRDQEELIKWGAGCLAGVIDSQEKWQRAVTMQDRITELLAKDADERPKPGHNYQFNELAIPNIPPLTPPTDAPLQ